MNQVELDQIKTTIKATVLEAFDDFYRNRWPVLIQEHERNCKTGHRVSGWIYILKGLAVGIGVGSGGAGVWAIVAKIASSLAA
jgi:hypothetical protein